MTDEKKNTATKAKALKMSNDSVKSDSKQAPDSEKFGVVHRNKDNPMDSINMLASFTTPAGKKLVGAKIITALQAEGYNTLAQIAAIPDVEDLTKVGGIGEKVARSIIDEVNKYYGIAAQTAYSYEDHMQRNQVRCSTGSRALDKLFDGGIATKQITELYGEPGMGKTQLCYMLAINALLPKKYGGFYDESVMGTDKQPRVYWLDTEFTFDTKRIRSIIANRYSNLDIDPDYILQNIILVQPVTPDDLIHELHSLATSPDNICMVIIDSLMSPFRSVNALTSFANLNPRQQKIQHLMGVLKQSMKVRNMAVVLTNQVTTAINIGGPMSGPPKKIASGGYAVAHTVTHRILLRRATKAECKARTDLVVRKAIVEDSPFIGADSALFVLNHNGVVDFSTELEKLKVTPMTGDSDGLIAITPDTESTDEKPSAPIGKAEEDWVDVD